MSNPAVSAHQQVTASSLTLIDASSRVQEENQWVFAESGDSHISLMNCGRCHLCTLRTVIKMLKPWNTDQFWGERLFNKGIQIPLLKVSLPHTVAFKKKKKVQVLLLLSNFYADRVILYDLKVKGQWHSCYLC